MPEGPHKPAREHPSARRARRGSAPTRRRPGTWQEATGQCAEPQITPSDHARLRRGSRPGLDHVAVGDRGRSGLVPDEGQPRHGSAHRRLPDRDRWHLGRGPTTSFSCADIQTCDSSTWIRFSFGSTPHHLQIPWR